MKALIIDDSRAMRSILRRIVTSLAGSEFGELATTINESPMRIE